jgi:hypothetical protein
LIASWKAAAATGAGATAGPGLAAGVAGSEHRMLAVNKWLTVSECRRIPDPAAPAPEDDGACSAARAASALETAALPPQR